MRIVFLAFLFTASLAFAAGPDCVFEDGEIRCYFPYRYIGIVLPFGAEDVPAVERLLRTWSTPEAAPCAASGPPPPGGHISLLLIFADDGPRPALREFARAREACRRCAGRVDYLSVNDSPIELFFGIMLDEQWGARNWTHLFWMHPHTRVVRAGWAEGVLHEASAQYREIWQTTQRAYFDYESDVRKNWNSLYFLRSGRFQAMVRHIHQKHLPLSTLEIHRAFLQPENRWEYHRLAPSELSVHAPWPLYDEFLDEHPNTYFFSGPMAWSEFATFDE